MRPPRGQEGLTHSCHTGSRTVGSIHLLGERIMTEIPSINAVLMPIMMLICAMNLFWNGRRTEGRSSLDAARLQAALTEELYLLARLYRSNLDRLDRAEVRLFRPACRSPSSAPMSRGSPCSSRMPSAASSRFTPTTSTSR